ncbi:DUF397 domain-containing protein [Kitasatospora sp. NBC_01287]|uniref:DUF397 domain-containing protein n=1 Tax=Kitasatospora sp. NBC_01287 TaxID=2903573 RepID=UPI0022539B45|nr:DUF397 domain-containing protein [Kitasatospora sp. NBC_01287]MCX4749577.1 DUF397 domain-containing protein [Kitasatospora sp. NBC_01287]
MGSVDLTRAVWRKAKKSQGNGECVEVAVLDGVVAMRDSKQHGRGPVLVFTPAEWDAFLDGAKGGEFDR